MSEITSENEVAAPAEGAAIQQAEAVGVCGNQGQDSGGGVAEQTADARAYAVNALRLRANGYEKPIPIAPGTKAPPSGFFGWTGPATDENVAAWGAKFPHFGTGLVCGSLVAIDIDILREGTAADMEQRTRERLGDTPLVRIGKAPKRLLVYRTEKPFSGFKRHPLEVLAQGNQFVAFAIHPDTGQPYKWIGQSPLEVPFASLPLVTEDMVHDLLVDLWDMLPSDLVPPPKSNQAGGKEKAKPRLTRALRDLCSGAIADYGAWVPTLFPRVRKVGGSWRVRPEWGGCDGSGNGLEEMLAFHRNGIRDFGNEVAMSALEVIEKAQGCSQVEAALWLAERLGVEYIPPPAYEEVVAVAKALTRESSPPEIRHALSLVARLEDDLERGKAEAAVKTQTKSKVGDIRNILAEYRAEEAPDDEDDLPKDQAFA